MTFYAYENWRARGHRVRVHRGECAYCNHGKGKTGHADPANAAWHKLEDCNDVASALEAARALPRVTAQTDFGPCAFCIKL